MLKSTGVTIRIILVPCKIGRWTKTTVFKTTVFPCRFFLHTSVANSIFFNLSPVIQGFCDGLLYQYISAGNSRGRRLGLESLLMLFVWPRWKVSERRIFPLNSTGDVKFDFLPRTTENATGILSCLLARVLHVYSLNDAEMLFKCLKYLISRNDQIKNCLRYREVSHKFWDLLANNYNVHVNRWTASYHEPRKCKKLNIYVKRSVKHSTIQSVHQVTFSGKNAGTVSAISGGPYFLANSITLS